MTRSKLHIEIRGPNSMVVDETGHCWCLQRSDEPGIQRCYDYITQSAQLALEY
jgi:hypothetical protein